MIFVSWERYGRASGKFGGALSYVGELGGTKRNLGKLLTIFINLTNL
jgi:hypothetical protein